MNDRKDPVESAHECENEQWSLCDYAEVKRQEMSSTGRWSVLLGASPHLRRHFFHVVSVVLLPSQAHTFRRMNGNSLYRYHSLERMQE